MRYLTVLILVLLARSAAAELAWDHNMVETRASPADKTVSAEYRFTNKGKQPVRIKSLQPSCGCTAAKPDKDVVNPGETGTITLKFDIGDRRGEQYKTVTVRTDESSSSTYVLGLKVHIEELVEMDRTVLLWRKGEPLNPKKIHMKVVGQAPLSLAKVKSTSESFDVSLEAKEAGREYELIVTPKATDKAAAATIVVESEPEAGHAQRFTARARVK
jgi:hypothetical protein